MRKILTCLLVILIISGCSSKPFEPVVRQTRSIIDLNEEVNLADLIQDVENVGLKIEATDSQFDSSVSGEYTVTFTISSGRKSTTKDYVFYVKDYDAPTLNCPDTIDLLYGNPFAITTYASAFDEIDGDLTDKIHYTGTINVWAVGQYPITLLVEDKYGNEASKELIINVKKDSSETYKSSICGDYIDSTYKDGQAPTITINEDGTFSMYLNSCSLINLIEGNYIQYEDTLYLITGDFEFSYTAESNLARMIIQLDGSLMWDIQTNLCAPSYGDIFNKYDPTASE